MIIFEFEDNDLIGLTKAHVQLLLGKNHIEYRIVMEDGIGNIVTMDYNPYRLNLTIENGLVTAFYYG